MGQHDRRTRSQHTRRLVASTLTAICLTIALIGCSAGEIKHKTPSPSDETTPVTRSSEETARRAEAAVIAARTEQGTPSPTELANFRLA